MDIKNKKAQDIFKMITKIINFFSPLSKIILVLALGTFAYFQTIVIPDIQNQTIALDAGNNVKIIGRGLKSASNSVVKGEQTQNDSNQSSNTIPTDNSNNSGVNTDVPSGRLYAFAKITDPSPSFANYTYISGDLIIKDTQMLRVKPNAIDSEKIEWHAIEAEDIDTGSITSRTIKDGTIQGKDISENAELNVKELTVSDGLAVAGPLQITDTTLVSNLNSDLLDGQHGTYYLPAGNISGAANYISKFTGASLLGNSLIYDNGTNIGIGTTDPDNQLTVAGDANFTGQMAIGSDAIVDPAYRNVLMIAETSSQAGVAGININVDQNNSIDSGDGVYAIGAYPTHSGTGSAQWLQAFYSSGDVSGSGDVENIAMIEVVWSLTGSGNVTNAYGLLIDTPYYGSTGLITNNYGIYIDDQSGIGTSGSFNLYSAGTTSKNYFAGNVGIGTTDPQYPLTVAGNMQLTGHAAIGTNAVPDMTNLWETPGGDSLPSLLMIDDTVTGGTFGVSTMLYLNPVVDSTATRGSYVEIDVPSTSNHSIATVVAGDFGVWYGGSGAANYLAGLVGGVQTGSSAGAVAEATGLSAKIDNGAASTITAVKGLDIKVGWNDGTIIDTYGVYVGDITTGTQTNTPYSFYASDPNTLNYFAGNVGIGDVSPDTTLKVVGSICARADGNNCTATAAGSIYAANFIAEGGAHLPDYVFEPNYSLLSIADLENYIALNKHLPRVPSANEVNQDGLNLGLMVPAILEKTEENTLYIIQNNDQISVQTQSIASLQLKIEGNATTIMELETDVNEQLTIVGGKLDELIAEDVDINSKIANINNQLLSLATLQSQVDEIKSALYVERYDELWNFYLVFKPESLANIVFKESGNINLLEGKITAKDIEALNTIKAKDIEATNNLKGDNLELGKATRGKGVIKSGETEVKIETPYASKDAQIYLTPLSKLDGGNLYVDMENVKEGENFTVKLDGNSSDKNIEFNWLIIK